MKDVYELCYSFVEDVSKHMEQMDIQYQLGLMIWTLSLVLSHRLHLN